MDNRMGRDRWKQTETKRNIGIETSHQLDETRKTRKLERKGMRTGGELAGTGRGRVRYGDVNGNRTGRSGAKWDGNENGTGTGWEQDGIGTEREWAGTGREWVMDGKILQWNHKW